MLKFIMTTLDQIKKLTKYNSIVVFIFTILLLVSFVLVAEEADRDKAIEIESDTMTVDDAKSISIYKTK